MRVGIVGMGWVGSSVAISTLHSGVANELLVSDIQEGLAEGEARDLAEGAPFYPHATVRSAAVEDMKGCDAVVIAAGRGGRPSESRLDLLTDNARAVRDIASRLSGLRGVLVVVTNPVDVLTDVALSASDLPPERVVGTGTMLDTARLRHRIGRELSIAPKSVHAQVVGEHGDSEVVLWSSASVGGLPVRRVAGWDPDREAALATDVRTAAYEIIQRKGATNHAIGLVTASLLRCLLRGEGRVLTVSRRQSGVAGVRDVCLSLPSIVGSEGAVEVLEPHMDATEREGLERSAAVLKEARAQV